MVRPVWCHLAEESPYTSFFLTSDWVDVWLTVFGQSLNVQILTFESQGRTVGCCLLVSRTSYRGPFRKRLLFLNTAGEDTDDEVCMEYNSILCLRGWEASVANALCAYVFTRRWDEFILCGCQMDEVYHATQQFLGRFPIECSTKPSCYVDLEALRHDGRTYESSLSPNTRSQIRRSLKLYEKMRGELEWDFATGIDSGLSMLDELASLHQASWSFKGKPGVFGSLRFLAFHRELISRALPQGNIDLVRISAGGHSIGVVYYFIYRGRVYYYQSGFSYGDDARLKPGLTTHYLMIMEYQRRGLLEYDFLAGNERYKMSLATHARDLLWTTIAFHNAKMRSLALLKTFKRAYERIARSS